ncbi:MULTISPECIES: carbohydrate ABC transporter permease [unclassified Curtobacterium]|uniref:carbohydrate ABC transporter permease n=1 Tax=unclassified Curtobacterium TaxID=257496 RepID=UPI0035A8250B
MSAATEIPAAIPNPQGLEPRKRRKGGLNAEHGRWAVYLIGPTIVLLAVVIGYPVVSAVIQSFQLDAGLDKATGLFVAGGFAGVTNYVHWLGQRCGEVTCPPGSLGSQFWVAFGNTFFFTVVTVVLETVIGLWMAIIMNRNFKGRALVRAAILVPWAIPTAVTAKLWYFIFDANGVLNHVIGHQVLWFSDEWASRFAIVIADTWKTTPFMALLILAGLQLIPDEVYEASKMDGASTMQRFLLITLPLVRPALMVAVLFRVLDALRIYDLIAIMTGGGGGSGNATVSLSVLVVDQIRQGFNAASALSTITFVIVFLVAFVFVRFLGANVVQTQAAQQKGELK